MSDFSAEGGHGAVPVSDVPVRPESAPVRADWPSGGPNIISEGHQNRSVASCTIARCAAEPRIMVSSSS